MKGIRAATILLMGSICAAASGQITQITAAKIVDGAGKPLAHGQIDMLPVTLSGAPIQPQLGGGGVILYKPAQCLIVAGAITTAVDGSTCTTADVSLANQQNFCYKGIVKDTSVTPSVLFPAMKCLQPTGSVWNLDTGYVPSAQPAQLMSTGPTGPAGPACSTGSGTCNMTVPIVLPADPVSALQAATKQYAQANLGATQAGAVGTTGVAKFPGAISSGAQISSGLYMVAYGDSLTYGHEGTPATNGEYPAALASLLGVSVVNAGVSGNTSAQICVRQGGCPTYATSGFTIPACASLPCSSGVAVVFTTGYEPVTSSGPAAGTSGTFSGIHGVVTWASSVYTFTPTQITTSHAVTGGTQFIVDEPNYNAVMLEEAGFNDGCTSSIVLPNVAAMVANRPAWQSYGVMPCLNSNAVNMRSGGTGYVLMAALNASLASTYGANYVTNSSGRDTRQVLVDYACASTDPVDQSNCTYDQPATSLRGMVVPVTSGTLTGAIGATDTTMSMHLSEVSVECCAGVGGVLVIEPGTANSEAVLITAGTYVALQTDVTWTIQRGYGGNQTSHANGVPVEAIDSVHLNAAGYALQAGVLADWLKRTVNYSVPFGAMLNLTQKYMTKDQTTSQPIKTTAGVLPSQVSYIYAVPTYAASGWNFLAYTGVPNQYWPSSVQGDASGNINFFHCPAASSTVAAALPTGCGLSWLFNPNAANLAAGYHYIMGQSTLTATAYITFPPGSGTLARTSDNITGAARGLLTPTGTTLIATGGNDVFIYNNLTGGTVWFYDRSGSTLAPIQAVNVISPSFTPAVLYSAAGTALPSCGSGIKGQQKVVSDATGPTYMGAYASGGGVTAAVICSYNGSTYAWLTH